jgi:2'-5' RNA ligase
VVEGLDRVFAAATVRIDGVSAFPSPARPQTLWVSLRDREGRLDELAAAIDRRIREAGFGPADKPWKSHLTLGRVRRERHLKVDPVWTGGLTWPARDFTIGTVALMQSELRPQGPRYTPLWTATAA